MGLDDSSELPSTDPQWGWQDIALLAGTVLPSLFVASVIARFASSNNSVRALVVQSAFYAFTLCWTWLLLRLKCDVAFRSAMALTWPAEAWRWAVAGPVVALGLGMAAVALRAPRAALPIESFLDSRAAVVVTGLFVVLAGPTFEELMFRGFVFPVAQRSFGTWGGILFSALSIALLHGPEYKWVWQHVVLITLVFVACGYARYRTGTTTAAILLHAGFNLTEFTGFLLSR